MRKVEIMGDLSFGWIGNGKKIRLHKHADVTKLTLVIKSLLQGYQKYEEGGIRAKNVIQYNGKIIYILSINRTGTTWSPYPLLYEHLMGKLDDFYLLLARGDMIGTDNEHEEISGEFWLLNGDTLKEKIWDKERQQPKLTYNEGRTIGGAYYSFPGSLLKEEEKKSFNSKEELDETLRNLL